LHGAARDPLSTGLSPIHLPSSQAYDSLKHTSPPGTRNRAYDEPHSRPERWVARRLPVLILLRVFETDRKGATRWHHDVWRMCRWIEGDPPQDCRPSPCIRHGAVLAAHARRQATAGHQGFTKASPTKRPNAFQNTALRLRHPHPGRRRSLDVDLVLPILTTWTTPAGIHVQSYRENNILGLMQSVTRPVHEAVALRVLMNQQQRCNEVRIHTLPSVLSPSLATMPRHYRY
jgi:hypothetical protein